MSQLSDYRRETAQLVTEARAAVQHGFALLSERPADAPLLAVLNAFTEYLDRLETDAHIRYDNLEEKDIVTGRLRKQRDGVAHECKALERWLKTVQEKLAEYQAQYPEPIRPAPSAEPSAPPPMRPKKASQKPIQQMFDFTERPPDSPKE